MVELKSELAALQTPALILDERKMMRNVLRLEDRIRPHGVSLRPHLKTVKSIEVARRILPEGFGPVTVSTLNEAEQFAAAGVRDIIYSVGIAAQKLDRVVDVRARGCDLSVILDNLDQARAVAEASARNGMAIPALIELDCDDHRSGVAPDDPLLLELGTVLHNSAAELRGVLTHAGESYEVYGREAHAGCAEVERRAAVVAAERLRAAGLPCPVVSVGSTPTAHALTCFDGLTEVRAGVFTFFDLFQAGIGVCEMDDIAISVLTTVIGHQKNKGWAITDAGWMAMSRDRGSAGQRVDQGYGLVCDMEGRVLPDLIVLKANQEHGIIAPRPGSGATLPEFPVGTMLRILPNHACATAAQYDRYHVIPEDPDVPLTEWSRFGGW
ncbi:D-threo-3-hydroxyaspartate dehydratase [Roseovarius albus]|uniref:D-threo-3-hydroxyaspartate dehydratase n=1 Tax=Roseovarius albus TaxID=1247867 RepID=A0A1X6Y5B2_9RHOB|nr:DSD1 family PLP-dependent enzyme [Roseovarius albus]SLN10856.1 D-threo-3-hydroxyaspartate dehydratase [Roseovarius albus]